MRKVPDLLPVVEPEVGGITARHTRWESGTLAHRELAMQVTARSGRYVS